MADPSSLDIARSAALQGVAHGFLGHGGGRFQFGFGGEGDPQEIGRQRAWAADAIRPGARLVAPHQVHSPDVLAVREGWEDTAEGRPIADAVVTDRVGLVLGIVTADCAPVLLADSRAGVIGAAHAGWRGALGSEGRGVLENTIDAMIALGARRGDIAASIGPTIAQASYEVDEDFRSRFAGTGTSCFSAGREGHWQFDLPAYVAARLAAAGIERIDDLALDTYAEGTRYYSYRRATHRAEPNYGRQLSLVALA